MGRMPKAETTRDGTVRIVLPDYFLDPRHREKPYAKGLYGILPKGRIEDPYSPPGRVRFCSNAMEWAYNNPRQPGSEIDGRTGKRMPFLDGSGANRVSVLGSLKEAWKEYERESGIRDADVDDLDVNRLEEDFFRFYETTRRGRLEASAEILRNYVKERREGISESDRRKGLAAAPFFTDDVWEAGCLDYVRHLVWTTPRGYLRELMFFSAVRELTGAEFAESDAASERRGIDGYLIADGRAPFPASVKPSTWSRRTVSPIYEGCVVIYRTERESYPDAVFEFESGGRECLSLGRKAG